MYIFIYTSKIVASLVYEDTQQEKRNKKKGGNKKSGKKKKKKKNVVTKNIQLHPSEWTSQKIMSDPWVFDNEADYPHRWTRGVGVTYMFGSSYCW